MLLHATNTKYDNDAEEVHNILTYTLKGDINTTYQVS